MDIKLHILNKGGKLDVYKDVIEKSFHETVPQLQEKIKLPDIDVVVVDNPSSTVPQTGVGGNAYTKNFLMISINPDFKDLETSLEKEMKSTLAHELHHCARLNAGYGWSNLADSLVTEGLADSFDIEINKTEPRPWSIAFNEPDLEMLLEKAKMEFTKLPYNHFRWFFGSSGEIPFWAGYSLGFWIVQNYLKKTNKKASELVSVAPGEIINNL